MATDTVHYADRDDVPNAERPAPAEPRRPPAAAVVLAVPLVLAALVAVVLLAFGLPAVKASPHDLPIGVAGPQQATAPVVAALQQRQPGAFAVTTYDDEAALVEAVRQREVYGGVVPGPQGVVVVTASAASQAVAQALTGLGTTLADQQGSAPTVRDVAALTKDDPRGAGLTAGLLPLVIGAIVPAVVLSRMSRSRMVRLVATVLYAAVAGLTFAAVLHYWFGTFPGDDVADYLAEAGVMAATIAAGAVGLLGLEQLLGRFGIGLGAAALVLLGNPLSGATTAPEFFESPWREIGQWMPPGAGSQLLRSVGFFDGAGPRTFFDGAGPIDPWVVLGAWVLAGVLLLAVPRRTSRAR